MSFIRATKASCEPAEARASIAATLFADGSKIAISACRSVSVSPAATWTIDSSRPARRSVSATSSSVTVTVTSCGSRSTR
jgi:hypothetical protein